jgi:hypothetical protein
MVDQCANLQRQHPSLTLRQLRRRYPQVQFQWPEERVQREALEEGRWRREVLGRSCWEILCLCANLAIVIGCLLLLFRLLTHQPLSRLGLSLGFAIALSIFSYHRARWGASAIMCRQVEKLTTWVIVTPSVALACGGALFAVAYWLLRLIGTPQLHDLIISGAASVCGFGFAMAGHWSELSEYVSLPSGAYKSTEQELTVARRPA